MILTAKIRKALNTASLLHKGQERKDGGFPYFVHLAAVAIILTEYTNDEDIIVAGILHDVLEDVAGYSYKQLQADFGERTATIVKEVSENKNPNTPKQNPTWEERKRGYLENLEKDSEEALLVCAADKLHNILSMIDAHKRGEEMSTAFNVPIERRIWFHGEVLKILKKRLESPLIDELEKAHKETEDIFLS